MLAPQARQIPYSEFKTDARQGLGREGLISDTLIRGELKPDSDGEQKAFVTVRVTDDQLVPELQAEGRRSSRGSTRARS